MNQRTVISALFIALCLLFAAASTTLAQQTTRISEMRRAMNRRCWEPRRGRKLQTTVATPEIALSDSELLPLRYRVRGDDRRYLLNKVAPNTAAVAADKILPYSYERRPWVGPPPFVQPMADIWNGGGKPWQQGGTPPYNPFPDRVFSDLRYVRSPHKIRLLSDKFPVYRPYVNHVHKLSDHQEEEVEQLEEFSDRIRVYHPYVKSDEYQVEEFADRGLPSALPQHYPYRRVRL